MIIPPKKILICIDWYEPGFKAGGPIRSIVNFVYHFKENFDISVFTADRDLGDETNYSGIEVNKWLQKEGYKVFYSDYGFRTLGNIKKLIQDLSPDIIYLNSMFSLYFSIYPLLMRKGGLIDGKFILAPRGMLKSSALQHRAIKKLVFLQLMRGFNIMEKVQFQATDDQEMDDITAVFGSRYNISRTGVLPGIQKEFKEVAEKTSGYLSMLFVGRIHPIKKLDYLLECLNECQSNITLTIVAPLEDLTYWNKCRKLISTLPSNIQVVIAKDVSHDKIESFLINNHIFALPTAGENFGHAIFEAFSSGRPVLISDQTPWRNLEDSHAGWDISLKNMSHFVTVIENVAAMEKDELDGWCRGAWNYCKNFLETSTFKNDYLKLLG